MGKELVGYTAELQLEVGCRSLGVYVREDEERELPRSGLRRPVARGGRLARELVAGLDDRDGCLDDWLRGRLEDPWLVARLLGASGRRQFAARRIDGSTGRGSTRAWASTRSPTSCTAGLASSQRQVGHGIGNCGPFAAWHIMGSAGLASTTVGITTVGSATVASEDAVHGMVKLHFYLDELDIYERAVLWWIVAGVHAELINEWSRELNQCTEAGQSFLS